jgi:Tricorn protease C1 domain
MNRDFARASTKALIVIIGLLATNGWCQKITSLERDRALTMLQETSSDIRKHYYDPKLHGVNWDAKIEEMKGKIKATDSNNRALSEIAAASPRLFISPINTA